MQQRVSMFSIYSLFNGEPFGATYIDFPSHLIHRIDGLKKPISPGPGPQGPGPGPGPGPGHQGAESFTTALAIGIVGHLGS